MRGDSTLYYACVYSESVKIGPFFRHLRPILDLLLPMNYRRIVSSIVAGDRAV